MKSINQPDLDILLPPMDFSAIEEKPMLQAKEIFSLSGERTSSASDISTPYIEAVSDRIADSIFSIVTPGKDAEFELAPVADTILSLPDNRMGAGESNSGSSSVRTYKEPAFPTIDHSLLGPDEEEIKFAIVPDPTSDIGESSVQNPSIDQVIPPETTRKIGGEKNKNTSDEIRTLIESDSSCPYLKQIREFHSRITEIETGEIGRSALEISRLSAIVFYLTKRIGIFFDYEEKWNHNKDQYIAYAKSANGSFFKRISLLFQGENIERKAHEIFLEKMEIFKRDFLEELKGDAEREDRGYIASIIIETSNNIERPVFQLRQLVVFEQLFHYYFQRLQDARNERQKKSAERARETSTFVKKELVAVIDSIEAYFDEHVFHFLGEEEDYDKKQESPEEVAARIKAKNEENRQARGRQ